MILEQTQFLRVLTRKYWFSVNMPSQKGHNYWTQPPETMKFWKNVPHIYILKAKTFKSEKILVCPGWEILGQKSGESGKTWNENFRNLTSWIHFYYQNEYYVKIWVKTKQISWFYSVFRFLGFLPAEFYYSRNTPSLNGHEF